jgi:hypothetical protein
MVNGTSVEEIAQACLQIAFGFLIHQFVDRPGIGWTTTKWTNQDLDT